MSIIDELRQLGVVEGVVTLTEADLIKDPTPSTTTTTPVVAPNTPPQIDLFHVPTPQATTIEPPPTTTEKPQEKMVDPVDGLLADHMGIICEKMADKLSAMSKSLAETANEFENLASLLAERKEERDNEETKS